ncbi:MAG TPA: hypothetical protein VGH12_04615 [Steroidobacteraceae bacterium]
MRQRNRVGYVGTAAALLMAAILSGCGGSSMNSGSAAMAANPSAPAGMNATTPPAVAQAMALQILYNGAAGAPANLGGFVNSVVDRGAYSRHYPPRQ